MKWSGFALVCALCCLAAPLFAGEKPADNMEIVREAMQAEKKLFIAENMMLTEAEAKTFWPVYEEYQKVMKSLVDRDIKLIEKYAANYDAMTNDVADKLIDEFLALEQENVKLRQMYVPKFRKVLPATKVARYFQLENKIRAVAEFDLATQIPVIPVESGHTH